MLDAAMPRRRHATACHVIFSFRYALRRDAANFDSATIAFRC